MGNLYEAIIDRLEEAKKETSFKDNDLIELGYMMIITPMKINNRRGL